MKPDYKNEVRIIGGKWRGRKLRFAAEPGLRPTPDRIRETVFNWLAPFIAGRRCLDLFAGSGAFGIEAMSRGAASAVLVEQSSLAVNQLKRICVELKSGDIHPILAELPSQITAIRRHSPFDLVFLDPPYGSDLLQTSFDLLLKNEFLSKNALVYIETKREAPLPTLPENWRVIKNQASAGSLFALIQAL